MIDRIYDWVRNLAFYLILITVVLNVLPENSYKKYVKFFSGMLLVLIILSPIAGLFDAGEKLDLSYESNSYRQQMKEFQSQSRYMEEEQAEKIAEANEESIKTQVENILLDNQLYPVSIEVATDRDAGSGDFGSLKSIEATVSPEPDDTRPLVGKIRIDGKGTDAKEEAVAKEIADFYHISEGHININIQR